MRALWNGRIGGAIFALLRSQVLQWGCAVGYVRTRQYRVAVFIEHTVDQRMHIATTSPQGKARDLQELPKSVKAPLFVAGA
jgi:hypothetical protein